MCVPVISVHVYVIPTLVGFTVNTALSPEQLAVAVAAAVGALGPF